MLSSLPCVPVGVGTPIKTIRQAAQKLMKQFPETSTSTRDVDTMLHDLEQLLIWMLGLDIGSQCTIEIKQRAACLSSGSIFCKLSLENQQLKIQPCLANAFKNPGSNLSYTTGRDETASSHHDPASDMVAWFRVLGQCFARLISTCDERDDLLEIMPRLRQLLVNKGLSDCKLVILTTYGKTGECVSRNQAKETLLQDTMLKQRLTIKTLSLLYNDDGEHVMDGVFFASILLIEVAIET